MKCPMCDGTGKSEIGVGAFTIHGADCDRCNGKGVIEPLTNEEWLKQCTTEQLAEVLFSWYKLGRLDAINKHTEVKKDWLIGWLKQPHNSPK